MAYARAVKQFFDWCDDHRLSLDDIEPIAIAAYIEQLGTNAAKPTVKQNLAAIRQLFDYLVTGGILPSNPAGSVRGPKYVVTRGKTPVLSGDEMRQLLDSIDTSELIGLRDRALIGLMGYSFARVSAVATLRVEDYFQQGRRSWLRLHEKGGKRHEVPCHHSLDEFLDAWIAAAGIGDEKKGPLFRSFKKGDKLTDNPITRSDVLYMIKRRAKPRRPPCPTPPAATLFARPGLQPIFKTAARSSMPSRSQPTSRRVPQKSTTGPRMRFRSTKWNASSSKFRVTL
jgi:site-specific recombinase XerD